jgi:hypothetical protein
MATLWNDPGRLWVEFWGKRRPAKSFSFQKNEIVTPEEVLRVPWYLNGTYLNLHPTLYAVAIASDGRIMHLRGGYNQLAPGRYTIHYVDRQNRVYRIPKVSEITLDGSQVSLEIVITYRVIDPIKALEVQQSVDTLFFFVQSDLKEFIRSRRYDEIVGGPDGRIPDNTLVARYTKDQHANRHPMSKLFAIVDIVVGEKAGDPKLTEIREKFQIEQRQNVADNEINKQNQELKRLVASQEAEIKKIRTQSDVDLQKLSQQMEMQKIQLDRAKKEQQVRQVSVDHAINALSEAFSSSAYPKDAAELAVVIKELLGEVIGTFDTGPDAVAGREEQSVSGSTGSPSTEKIDKLTDTILSLLNRKRS